MRKFALAVSVVAFGAMATLFAGIVIDPATISFNQVKGGAEIVYTLGGDPTIVTMEIQTNTLAHGEGDWIDIGGENVQHVSGDVNRIVRETGTVRKIHWRAYEDTGVPGSVAGVWKGPGRCSFCVRFCRESGCPLFRSCGILYGIMDRGEGARGVLEEHRRRAYAWWKLSLYAGHSRRIL